MKKETLIFVIFVIALAIGAGYSIFTFYQLATNSQKVSCEFGKMRAIIYIFEDVKRAEEDQQLCNNQNCTNYFQNIIDIKADRIKQIEENYNCDEILGAKK